MFVYVLTNNTKRAFETVNSITIQIPMERHRQSKARVGEK